MDYHDRDCNLHYRYIRIKDCLDFRGIAIISHIITSLIDFFRDY